MAENMRPAPENRLPVRRRATTWLVWWILMMALWVMLDDSIQFDELLAGAGAAAIAASAAELAAYQASVRYRPRLGWRMAAEIVRLPAEVARDTLIVFGALARMLVTGRAPEGGYAEVPAGGPDGEAGGVLLTGIRSLAPNTFVVGVDAERDVLLVHRLVSGGASASMPGGAGR
jgi:multisubunit Na+/H+ antiporter MnhE subunit